MKILVNKLYSVVFHFVIESSAELLFKIILFQFNLLYAIVVGYETANFDKRLFRQAE